jgi:hypothetical protein
MGFLNRDAFTGRAALLLPEPPAALELLTDSGGVVRIELLSRNGLSDRARAPRLRVHVEATVTAQVAAVDGGGHDVEMLVAGVEPETEWTAIVRLEVTAIHEQSTRREAARRVRIGERAPLFAMACGSVATGARFEVEVSGLSATEIGLVSDRELQPGDLVALMPTVDGQAIRIRARVIQVEPIDAVLTQVMCEIAAITDANRQRIARAASG